jgi:hypothetical protein
MEETSDDDSSEVLVDTIELNTSVVSDAVLKLGSCIFL